MFLKVFSPLRFLPQTASCSLRARSFGVLPVFQIDAGLDAAILRRGFETHGHLQIPGFLTKDSATTLYEELHGSTAWRLTANRGEEIHHFDLGQVARWTAEQHRLLEKAVNLGGRYEFQFRYE